MLPDYIAVGTLARSLGVDRDALQPLNLGLKTAVWNGTKKLPKGYELRLPPISGDPQLLLASLPRDAWTRNRRPTRCHVVQRGETLSSIAPRYGARVQDLVAINSLTSAARIRVGQRLILPAGVSKNATESVVEQGVYPAATVESQQPVPTTTVTAITVAANTPAMADATESDDASDDQDDAVASAPPTPEQATAVVDVEQQKLSADPSDYSVAADRTIRVQEDETIGHFADWLGVRASDLRRINSMKGTSSLRVGKRLKLDFSKTTPEQFEAARLTYHQRLQAQFFANHQIVATSEHVVKRGESIWMLAGHRYNIPVWLLRQYNPDLDLSMVKPSTRVVIPVLASPGV